MFINEHQPPHFHVEYQDYKAMITIEDGIVMGTLPLVWVTGAQYMGGYKIAVIFNDGKSKTVDLESHLTGQVLSPLKDLNLFRDFKVTGWTIEWANGSDIAPEFLYNC